MLLQHKAACVQYARQFATEGVVPPLLPSPHHQYDERIQDLLDELDHACPEGLTHLEECVKARVAFYHAGLHSAEQKILEAHFSNGTLRLLVATTSLAEGVNLPVRRVIHTSLKLGKEDISALKFHQMSGRAGRAGLEDLGEAFLIVESQAELERGFDLATAPMPKSRLSVDANPATANTAATTGRAGHSRSSRGSGAGRSRSSRAGGAAGDKRRHWPVATRRDCGWPRANTFRGEPPPCEHIMGPIVP